MRDSRRILITLPEAHGQQMRRFIAFEYAEHDGLFHNKSKFLGRWLRNHVRP